MVCGTEGIPLYSDISDTIFRTPGNWSFRRCPAVDCGLIWLDPAPIESDIGQAYDTYYTRDVGGKPRAKWLHPYRRVRSKLARMHLQWRFGDRGRNQGRAAYLTEFLLKISPSGSAELEFPMPMLPPPATGRILEIGFGQGWLLKSLGDLGWDAEGLEADEVTVANARRRNLKVKCGSLEEQNYAADSFDAIVSSHVIEHVHEPLRIMREARRILRPGGRFIAATPNAHSITHQSFGAAWRGLEPPRHLHIFTPESAKTLARQAGFAEPEIRLWARGAIGEWNNSREIRRRTLRPCAANGTLPKGRGLAGHIASLAQKIPGLIEMEHRTELVLIATK